jgi:hypothetical protein
MNVETVWTAVWIGNCVHCSMDWKLCALQYGLETVWTVNAHMSLACSCPPHRTNSVEHKPCWVYNRLTQQDNQTTHCRVHKNMPFDPILSKINSLHKISKPIQWHLRLVLPGGLPLRFSNKCYFVSTFHLPTEAAYNANPLSLWPL